jgi:hypothetical protein
VDIPKNGNCLFTAVGFQLQLGIKSELSLTEIAAVLRNLVVDEWTGPYTDEYLDFFHVDSIVNFVKHVETYTVDILEYMGVK